MKNNLPKGWIECSLGDVCTKPQYGWTSKASKNGKIKYLRTTDISNGNLNWETVPYCLDEPSDILKYQVYKNDILVSRAGSVGFNFRITDDVNFKAVFASYLIRFRTFDEITSRYVEYFLKSESYWKQISDFTAGIAIPNVNASKLEGLRIPISPLAEQQRIVAKLYELMEKLDRSRARLERVPKILKRFRQSVLSAAVSGKLTEEWRTKNEIANEHSIDGPYEIPVSWTWSKFREIGSIGRGKSKHRPRNDSSLYGGKYPFIQTGDIANSNGLIVSHRQTYSEKGLAQSKLWPSKTVCITIAANIADSAVLTYPACFPDSVVGFTANEEKSDAQYIEFFIRTIKDDLWTFAPATAQKNINLAILEEVLIATPPLREQVEIVRVVSGLFHFVDKIEARYNKVKNQLDQLPQSLLAKAFRGELVPQDENDEPASELLNHINSSSNSKERKGKLSLDTFVDI